MVLILAILFESIKIELSKKVELKYSLLTSILFLAILNIEIFLCIKTLFSFIYSSFISKKVSFISVISLSRSVTNVIKNYTLSKLSLSVRHFKIKIIISYRKNDR